RGDSGLLLAPRAEVITIPRPRIPVRGTARRGIAMWAAMDRWSGVSVAMRVAPAELPNDAAAHFRPGCPLRGRILFTILAGLLLSQSLGCVHRRMTIRSDPPGALVLLEGEEIGYTPVSVDFTYYGTREIT